MPSRTRTKRPQLSAFIAAKRATDDRSARRRSLTTLDARGPAGLVFSPTRHGLSWEQCQLATRLLARAEARRPFTGSSEQVRFRRALRIAGILSAVKRGVVGNSRFGRRLQGHHGGNVMRDHGLQHLREISPIGLTAARAASERQHAAQYFEEHGVPLPIGAKPPHSPEAQRIQDLITAWEATQWQTQRDFLSW